LQGYYVYFSQSILQPSNMLGLALPQGRIGALAPS